MNYLITLLNGEPVKVSSSDARDISLSRGNPEKVIEVFDLLKQQQVTITVDHIVSVKPATEIKK